MIQSELGNVLGFGQLAVLNFFFFLRDRSKGGGKTSKFIGIILKKKKEKKIIATVRLKSVNPKLKKTLLTYYSIINMN